MRCVWGSSWRWNILSTYFTRLFFFFFTLKKGGGALIAADIFFLCSFKSRTKVALDSKNLGVIFRCSLPLWYRVASASDKITEFHRCRVTFLIPPVSRPSMEQVNYGRSLASFYIYIYISGDVINQDFPSNGVSGDNLCRLFAPWYKWVCLYNLYSSCILSNAEYDK